MNIENFNPIEGLTFDEIFRLQSELEFKYEPETKEIFDNFDIDCYSDQEFFKKRCWRITEELCEAIEAIDNKEESHINEELLDGFNFLIELESLYGFKIEDLDMGSSAAMGNGTLKEGILSVIAELGLAANCLKNRAWRQSQYMVDLYVFERRLKNVFNLYINLMRKRMSDKEILDNWSLKYQVNNFRLQTRY